MNVYEKLAAVQTELKAPKSQRNDFGAFNYRSCEDILETLKPLLHKAGALVTISDEIVNIAGRFYVKATARFHDLEAENTVEVTAYAREPESRVKMDDAQTTGSSSSYARKYALNGLFCIDDTKDPDATNTGQQEKGRTAAGRGTKRTGEPEKVQQSHINTIRAEIRRTGAMEKAVCYQYKLRRLEEMTIEQFKGAMEIFRNMLDKIPEGQQYEMQFDTETYESEMSFR